MDDNICIITNDTDANPGDSPYCVRQELPGFVFTKKETRIQ